MDCRCGEEGRRYLKLSLFSIGLFFFELVSGIGTGSVALVADALHVLVDGFENILSYVTVWLARNFHHEDAIRRRAGYISGTLLLATAVFILREGIERMFSPTPVSWWMIIFAAVGFCVNLAQIAIHRKAPDEHRNITHMWQDTHIISDALASLGVIMGGIIIATTGWSIVDPLVSIAIGIRILWMIGERFSGTNCSCSHHHHH
ncbi:MAG TPA: cation diffusion facilitator family transporter [Candidatus Paceibacterota bacterium]